MEAVKEAEGQYLAAYSELEKNLSGSGPAWLGEVRRAAIHKFAELGVPTTRHEEWKYTNLAPLARTSFQPPRTDLTPSLISSLSARLSRSVFAELKCNRLVFLNGRYSRELSRINGLPLKVEAGSLAEAMQKGDMGLEPHLSRHAKFDQQAFVALNTAFMQDGAFIQIPKGTVLETPMHVLFVTAGDGLPTVTYPRNLILAGRESQVTLIESHLGLGGGNTFTNAVTEVVLGENAVVEYSKIQAEGDDAFHVGALQFQLARSSNLSCFSNALGSALAREDIQVVMGGEGAECHLNGLYVTRRRQHVDNHTVIDHAKPHCNSREVYKGILDGQSTGVFNGKIIVRKDAQKTDAKQSNRNLLLSAEAQVNTKPQLEIYADDVKCTHGATVGQMDQEALFYLRSRCIAHREARNLLTYAFANEVIERIKYEPLRARLHDAVLARLSVE